MSLDVRAAVAAAVVTTALGAFVTPVAAQETPAKKANQINDEGKKLFAEENYEPAAKKFEQAIVLSPEGRFYFNHCFTLYFLERYPEALAQCKAVEPNGADEGLREKTNKLIVEIEKRMPADAGTPPPTDGGGAPPTDGGAPPTDGGAPPTDGGAPPPTVTTTGRPVDPFGGDTDPFKWSLGAELGGIANLSVGGADDDNYVKGGAVLRLFAEFVLSDRFQFGLQPYFQYTFIEAGDFNIDDQPLRMFDFGAGAFINQRLGLGRLYWQPFVGLHISAQDATGVPEDLLVAVGARAEVQLGYLFGRGGRHAITLTPGFNVYSASSETSDTADAEMFGLDQPSATFGIAIGYQLRFATPFGARALVQLE